MYSIETNMNSAKRGVQPNSIDETKTQRLIDEISRGVSPFLACRIADVQYGTFRRWMRLGNAGYEGYYQFMIRIEAAQGMSTVLYDAEYVSGMGEIRGKKPLQLSPLEQDSIIRYLRNGLSLREASLESDVSYSTVKSWLRRGGYSRKLTEAAPVPATLAREPYKSFARNVELAEKSSSVRN